MMGGRCSGLSISKMIAEINDCKQHGPGCNNSDKKENKMNHSLKKTQCALEAAIAQIAHLETCLKTMEKELSSISKSHTRYRAKVGETYYVVSVGGVVAACIEQSSSTDKRDYEFRNYYETEEEAQKVIDRKVISHKIMDIADELNAGKNMSRSNSNIKLYSLYWNYVYQFLDQVGSYRTYFPDEILCRSSSFIDVVKERLTTKEIRLYFER